jgi:two-component system, NtrC family, sensor kinase
MKFTLQTKLIASFLTVIVTCGAIATLVGVRMVSGGIVNQAQDKVRLDLNSARVIYEQAIAAVRDAVRHTAPRFFIREALTAGAVSRLAGELDKIRRGESLDILTLTDSQGKVLLRTRNPALAGDSQADRDIVKRVLRDGNVAASTEIAAIEELRKEGEDLVNRARIAVVATPRAKPTQKTEQTSGMLIIAAVGVMDASGRILGVLYGGRLLDRDYSLVDKIKETVYQGEVYGGKDMGTATICQGDLRISTNVMGADGRRAIGTRVSAEVCDRVLAEGKSWFERAFVVNDWYVTAYEPIRDVAGGTVGILSVGMLEKKFTDMKRNALLTFVGITLGGIGLSIAICYVLTNTLVRPVNELMLAAQSLASGNLEQHVRENESTREIAALGHAFNSMAASIKKRDEQLRQRAAEEIVKSERLAMVGRLAAGVAHEINNPLGGILLFSRLLLKKAPVESLQRENLERIAKEAERCRTIVQGLLEFARQREPEARIININDVILQAVALLENQALFNNIKIVKQLGQDLPRVHADSSQMEQVFVNMIINAAEAMNGNGVLTVITQKGDDDKVEVSFKDTGCGIPEENLHHLFEPFFTTKEVGRGTGLGLSISHGIVQRHGGNITVASTIGKGSTFVITLSRAKETS